jgi:hypothetical protein
MKAIWFWQKKDSDINSPPSEQSTATGHQNKIMYYHWNCRYPKIKW